MTRHGDLLSKEKLFPIYTFSLEYVIEHPTKYWDEIGHLTETCEVDYMAPEPMTVQELEDKLRAIWLNALKREPLGSLPTLADQGAKLLNYCVSLKKYDNWCLTWFSHQTRNVHLSDEDLLESFRRFVERMYPAHDRLRYDYQHDDGREYYCLMGAEDRWRWKGPCRCEHCVAQGVTRIDH